MIEEFSDGGSPIKSWAIGLEDTARRQIVNVSRLPFVIGHVALMPDAHMGYGMPVGGVFMADEAIVPYAIGVDIGCGVALIETGRDADEVSPEGLAAFLERIARDVPVGNGPHGNHPGQPHPVGPSMEVPGRLQGFVAKAEVQLGTLGGGNHFLELQRGADDGLLYFMIHSGSRSLGKKTCDLHHRAALKQNRRRHDVLPHDEVAYFPLASDGGRDYWADMQLALAWAEENRRRMARAVIAALRDVLGIRGAQQTLDVHHNYAARESHLGRDGIVHRKGAVRARAGELVLIPGSMSTGSYIARGLGNREAFDTCPHGAGRARSRTATRRMVSLEQLDAMLEDAGVQLVTPKRAAVTDESAPAYKDIDVVMEASADLVEPVQRLIPMGVVKG